MIKQPKLTKTTKQSLKKIIQKEQTNSFTNDALDAFKINGEITGKEVIKKYNEWKRNQNCIL